MQCTYYALWQPSYNYRALLVDLAHIIFSRKVIQFVVKVFFLIISQLYSGNCVYIPKLNNDG